MSQEDFSTVSPIDAHLKSLSDRLVSVPELQPVADMIISDPSHANEMYRTYLGLAGLIDSLDETYYNSIERSQSQMHGEVGSASTVGANDLSFALGEKALELSSIVSASYDSSSLYYQPAVDDLVDRMEGGHLMKVTGMTPSDHDPDSLKVIWGHTVITGKEALLHFVMMHYLERFVSKALLDAGVQVAQQKDFFINAMTDIVILNGLKNPGDPIFNLWVTPKDQDGMGWITKDRLNSYK